MKRLALTAQCIIVSIAVFGQVHLPSAIANDNNAATAKSIDIGLTETHKVNYVKPLIVPASMITLGVLSLNKNFMGNLNLNAKTSILGKNTKYKTTFDNYLQYTPAAAVYFLNIVGVKGKNNLRDRSMILAMSGIITCVSTHSVKRLAHIQRPDGSNFESFPSGHTATAFACAEFLRQEYGDQSPWYGVAGYTAASFTGVMRMYNNKHWLGDVLAGAGFGIISTKLAYWLYPSLKRSLFKDKPVNVMVMPYYQSGSTGLAMNWNLGN